MKMSDVAYFHVWQICQRCLRNVRYPVPRVLNCQTRKTMATLFLHIDPTIGNWPLWTRTRKSFPTGWDQSISPGTQQRLLFHYSVSLNPGDKIFFVMLPRNVGLFWSVSRFISQSKVWCMLWPTWEITWIFHEWSDICTCNYYRDWLRLLLDVSSSNFHGQQEDTKMQNFSKEIWKVREL